jgi:hypothetical protein
MNTPGNDMRRKRVLLTLAILLLVAGAFFVSAFLKPWQ